MPISEHKNFAISTLATPPSSTDGTSLVVASGTGALFPSTPFNVTVWPASVQPTSSNAEIMRVTVKATDTFTVTRAQEGTSGRTHAANAQIAATITARTLTDVEYGAHGVINVMDPVYGATGDGVTDDTSAVQLAVDACELAGGGRVYAPVGSYRLTTAVTVPANVTVEGAGKGTVFIQDGTVACFTALGTAATAKNLTANATIRAQTVTMDAIDGDTFVANDYALLRSTEAIPSSTASATYGEIVRVTSEAAGVVTLDGPIHHGYTTANTADLQELALLDGVQFRNFRITNPDPGTKAAPGILLRYCLEPRIEDIWGDGLDGALVNIQHTVGGVVDGVWGRDLTDDSGNGRLGYVVSVAGAVMGTRINNIHGERVRHTFTTSGTGASGANAGQPYGVTVSNSTSLNPTHAGFDTHHEGSGITFSACVVLGSTTHGFQIRSPFTTLSGCHALNCVSDGFLVLADATDCTLIGCNAVGTVQLSTSAGGFHILGNRALLVGITASACERHGLYIDTAQNVTVVGGRLNGNNTNAAASGGLFIYSSDDVMVRGLEITDEVNAVRLSTVTDLSLSSCAFRNISGTKIVGTVPTVALIQGNEGLDDLFRDVSEPVTGTTQVMADYDRTASALATTRTAVERLRLVTPDTAYTTTDGMGLYVRSPSKGAASTITNLFGIYLDDQSVGGTANYAIYTNAGLVRFGDNAGVGATPTAAQALLVQRSLSGSTTQRGILSIPTGSSAATTEVEAIYAQGKTAAASFTCGTVRGVRIADASKGAASTITTQVGLEINNQTQGATNYSIRTGTGPAFFGDKVQIQGTTAAVYAGTGTPEAAVTAVVGSVYLRTDGGAATSFYVKESGTGNTGWVAK